MAYVKADYLVDILGSVTDFETRGFIVYIPKLGRDVILSADLYEALDRQELESYNGQKAIEKEALNILEDFIDKWKNKKIERQEVNNNGK